MNRDEYGDAYQGGFERTVRFLLSRGVHWDKANEVAQSAWAIGWERREQLRNENLVVTWVNAIALNVYRAGLRRESFHEILLDQPDEAASIDFIAIDLKRILNFCRPSNRRLLEECLNGVSAADIARQSGVSDTAIRIRLLRARRDARLQLEKKRFNGSRESHAHALRAAEIQ